MSAEEKQLDTRSGRLVTRNSVQTRFPDRQRAFVPTIKTALRYPRGAWLALLGREEEWRRWNETTSDSYYDRLGRQRIETSLASLGLPLKHGLDHVFAELSQEVKAGQPNATDLKPTLDEITSRKAAFVPVLYHVVRCFRPQVVVETGVARGGSSVAILAAMEANGFGELYSVDLLPANEVGELIPERLRAHWHFLSGDSVTVLVKLLPSLGEVGVFFHDSCHAKEHMLKEFRIAHSAKVPVILADNVEFSSAFRTFFGSFDDWTFREIRYNYRQILGVALRNRSGGTRGTSPIR